MREITRYLVGLLIGPVLVIAGIVVDSSWHATDHAVHLASPLWFLGLLVLLFLSVRMFLAHIALVRATSAGGRQRLKSMRTATLSLYIGIAGAGLLLLGGLLDSSWHHDHRQELDVFSPLHPYHSLVLVGLVANVAAGVRLFTAQVELSLRGGEAQSLSPLGTSVTPTPSGPLTILFTDMESSTGLTQRLGDEQAQQLVRVHNNIVRAALVSHTGSEIKHTGDGIMASFQSASRALECAIAIQRGVAQRSRTSSARLSNSRAASATTREPARSSRPTSCGS